MVLQASYVHEQRPENGVLARRMQGGIMADQKNNPCQRLTGKVPYSAYLIVLQEPDRGAQQK